jgi:hypothetical protein
VAEVEVVPEINKAGNRVNISNPSGLVPGWHDNRIKVDFPAKLVIIFRILANSPLTTVSLNRGLRLQGYVAKVSIETVAEYIYIHDNTHPSKDHPKGGQLFGYRTSLGQDRSLDAETGVGQSRH